MTDATVKYAYLSEIVSDDEVKAVFGGTNFGAVSPRAIIADTLLKMAGGYCSGYTALQCCMDLGLIVRPKTINASKTHRLTKKGRRYLFWAFEGGRQANDKSEDMARFYKLFRGDYGSCATCEGPFKRGCICKNCGNQSPHVSLEDRTKYGYPPIQVTKERKP